jgi:hypothetical protein
MVEVCSWIFVSLDFLGVDPCNPLTSESVSGVTSNSTRARSTNLDQLPKFIDLKNTS